MIRQTTYLYTAETPTVRKHGDGSPASFSRNEAWGRFSCFLFPTLFHYGFKTPRPSFSQGSRRTVPMLHWLQAQASRYSISPEGSRRTVPVLLSPCFPGLQVVNGRPVNHLNLVRFKDVHGFFAIFHAHQDEGVLLRLLHKGVKVLNVYFFFFQVFQDPG